MKLHLLSYLHNEFLRSKSVPPITNTDAVLGVLAGDIDTGVHGLVWAASEVKRLGRPVIYVAGNHEYYHHDIAQEQSGTNPNFMTWGLENFQILLCLRNERPSYRYFYIL